VFSQPIIREFPENKPPSRAKDHKNTTQQADEQAIIWYYRIVGIVVVAFSTPRTKRSVISEI